MCVSRAASPARRRPTGSPDWFPFRHRVSGGLTTGVASGITIVAAAGLCITTVVSYLSHSQVWARQQGSTVLVGGKTNRAKLGFRKELADLLTSVPEVGPSAAAAAAAVDQPVAENAAAQQGLQRL